MGLMTTSPTSRVTELTDRELDRFAAFHPRSGELRDAAEEVLLSGVPMNWMTRWPGAWPVVFDTAEGARLTDVDGNSYVDFCLGDTGAMAGHSPAPTVDAAAARMAAVSTTVAASEAGRRGDDEALRADPMAVQPHRDRREPLRTAALPGDHRAAEDPRLQPLLPRVGRRDRGDARRRGARAAAVRQRRAAGADHRDDAGGRVERRRRA